MWGWGLVELQGAGGGCKVGNLRGRVVVAVEGSDVAQYLWWLSIHCTMDMARCTLFRFESAVC